MYDCYCYFLVPPLLNDYCAQGEKAPISNVDIQFNDSLYNLAIFGEKSVVHFVRIKIPGLEKSDSGNLPEKACSRIQIIKEHALSILRILYDNTVSFHKLWMITYVPEGNPPEFKTRIAEPINESWEFPANNFTNIFKATINCRNEIKLLADGLDERLPLQYRYLSIYKIFETVYFDGTKPTAKFDDFIRRHELEYTSTFKKQLGLKGYIIDLRARCAHIRANKNATGVTMLSNKDAVEIEEFMPFMIKLAKFVINELPENSGVILY